MAEQVSTLPEGDPEFRSYYGRPVIKEPVWKVPDVPGYFFLGGLAGASATMAALADLTGRQGLARVGRYAASGGALASLGALVHDLGRPERFLNMLRVFKPTSPLSVGSWIIAPFSALASASAMSSLTGVAPGAGRLAGVVSGGLGPAMCTYTAVLLADTAVPSWHEAYRELPFVFGGGALTSAAGVGLLAAPPDQQGPARRMGLLGAGMELAAGALVERRHGLVSEPYRTGRAKRWLRAGQVLTGVGGGLSLVGRSRATSAVAGAAYLAGAVATRFGVFDAGMASARDPKYVVVPQRERLARHS